MASSVDICETKPSDKISTFLQDVQYHSLMVNSASFNVRLMKDRKTRLPFLDSQTGIAQNSCKLYMKACHRMPGILYGQIYAYPAQRWCRKKRSYVTIAYQAQKEAAEAYEHSVGTIENSVSTANEDSNASFETKSHEMYYYDDSTFLEEEDEPDNEDDDTYCVRTLKKRKKAQKPKTVTKSGRGRKRRDPSTFKIITDADDEHPDKPYECALCGARYKTRQGLSYHLTHTHPNGSNSSASNMKNQMSVAHSELSNDGSMMPHANFSYIEHPHQMVPMKQPDSLTGLNDFQDSYMSFMSSSSQDNSLTSFPGTNMDMTDKRIILPEPIEELSQAKPEKMVEKPVDDIEVKICEQEETSQPTSSIKDDTPQQPEKVATPNSYCDFCLGNATLNYKTREPEEMVSCADCGRAGHLSCLQFTPNMIISVRQYRWQCIECKCCTLCGTSENDDKLLFCDDCDRGYHLYCLVPPLLEPPEGEWSCKLCKDQFHKRA